MKGSKKYRALQNDLDKVGILTLILKTGKKEYNFIVNSTIVACFKKRDSANKRILKLYNKNYEAL